MISKVAELYGEWLKCQIMTMVESPSEPKRVKLAQLLHRISQEEDLSQDEKTHLVLYYTNQIGKTWEIFTQQATTWRLRLDPEYSKEYMAKMEQRIFHTETSEE